MSDSSPASDEGAEATPSNHGVNHLLWFGPLLTVAGFASYFTIFVQWPTFRDSGWFNLLLVFAALFLSYRGMRTAMVRGGWRTGAGIAAFAFSAIFALLLPYYLFGISSEMPSTELAATEGSRIPALTLMADDGSPVELAEAAVGPLVLLFYRGYW